MQLTYGDTVGDFHGMEQDTNDLIELADGEFITEVSGEIRQNIATDVVFTSNLGNEYGPFGSPSGLPEDQADRFEYSVDLGNGEFAPLVAFKGTTDFIGVLTSMSYGFGCGQRQTNQESIQEETEATETEEEPTEGETLENEETNEQETFNEGTKEAEMEETGMTFASI